MSSFFSLEIELVCIIILWVITFIFIIFSENELTLIICVMIFIVSYPYFQILLQQFQSTIVFFVEEYFFLSLLFGLAYIIFIAAILFTTIQAIYIFISG